MKGRVVGWFVRRDLSSLGWSRAARCFTSRREESERRCELCRLLQFGFGAVRSSCTPIGLFGSCQTCIVLLKKIKEAKNLALFSCSATTAELNIFETEFNRAKKTHDQHTAQRMIPIHSHLKIARAHQHAVVWRAICSWLEPTWA